MRIRGGGNFQLVMNFVTNLFHSFTLGGDVRYGLAVFGNRVQVKTSNVLDYDAMTASSKIRIRIL